MLATVIVVEPGLGQRAASSAAKRTASGLGGRGAQPVHRLGRVVCTDGERLGGRAAQPRRRVRAPCADGSAAWAEPRPSRTASAACADGSAACAAARPGRSRGLAYGQRSLRGGAAWSEARPARTASTAWARTHGCTAWAEARRARRRCGLGKLRAQPAVPSAAPVGRNRPAPNSWFLRASFHVRRDFSLKKWFHRISFSFLVNWTAI